MYWRTCESRISMNYCVSFHVFIASHLTLSLIGACMLTQKTNNSDYGTDYHLLLLA